ncbi:MAG TPA: protein translocase subunit SecD [Candidatus Eisenbacteria bacterium]|nr:protein translocase subunit SecD [Candidatus Eisenbacteria bacterium]
MGQGLWVRFLVIGVTVGFLGYLAAKGVAENELELGIDLKGGTELVFQFNFDNVTARAETLTTAIGIIQQRIDGFGLKDISIQPIGDRGFAVQISATDKEKVDAVKEIITQLGKLEFRITVEPDSNDNYLYYWKLFQDRLAKNIPSPEASRISPADLKPEDHTRYPQGLRWYELSNDAKKEFPTTRRPATESGPQPWVLCKLDEFNVSGEDLDHVRHSLEDGGRGPNFSVHFEVRKLAQGRMSDLTANEGDFMAILLNEEVNSAPVLKSTLSRNGEISGSFSEEKAKQLAAVLQAGALQEKPALVSERTIAPDLAGTARDKGILSVALGFAVVLVVMVWYYYGAGLLANVALLLNLVLLVGVLVWFGAVLTLPGLAGIVLTVGMSVDANILVYERMREERERGRTVAQAIGLGYERALVTIIDSNLTTLITAYFLFQLGSGPVRGFGVTLAIGIVASMFTALYVTHAVFDLLLKKKRVTELRMRPTRPPPPIPWTGRAMRVAVISSAIAMVAGVLVWEGAPDKIRYDLDFTQGSKLIMRFASPQSMADVREALDDAAHANSIYREISLRATAEGVGQTVTADSSPAFELRSQLVADKDQIDEMKAMLRETFRGRLLPGPFKSTIRPAEGGGLTGEIYFASDRVRAELLEAAFRQFADAEQGALRGARVEALEPPPGAGSAFRVTFPSDHKVDALVLNARGALDRFDLEKAKQQAEATAASEQQTPAEQEAGKRIRAALETYRKEDLASGMFKECDPFPLADLVNPSTAEEHRDAAAKAMAFSLLGIIVYVAFRFRSWPMGFASVIALIHDVIVTLGVATLANWLGIIDARLNLVTVAAYLTLIGYSINDTIVIFDRIRENRGASGRTRLAEIIDRSINQTLSRTIRTSLTVFIVVVILLVFNYGANSSLEGFAFVLTFGVVTGTYSTIFIASPTLLYLPWLWERSGGSAKSLFRKSVPYIVAAAGVLIGGAYLHPAAGAGAHDWTVPVFNNLLLSVPVGVLAFFLWNFVVFVRMERADAEAA